MIRLIALILLLPSLAWAGFSVSGITDPASVAGIAEPASVAGIDSDYSADVTAPTLTSATIPAAGTSISLLFSEVVNIGAGGNAGWAITMTGGAATMTYASGDGTDTLVYTLSATINSAETGTVAYTQPGNGIEDDSGNDLETIVSAAATNNSTQYNSGFTGDSNLTALYRFENGALTTDSKGTNTLTDNNTVGTDTVNFKQGAASADLELSNSEYFSITDTNLDAGFPLKNGDSTKNISVSAWIKIESVAEGYEPVVLAKWDDTSDDKKSFWAGAINDSGTIYAQIGFGFNSGTTWEGYVHASALSTATWYHITWSYQNSDKAYAIRVRSAAGAVVGTDKTGTATLDANKLTVNTSPLYIGAYETGGASGFWDGLIDELVVFKDIISEAEATAISKGIYR